MPLFKNKPKDEVIVKELPKMEENEEITQDEVKLLKELIMSREEFKIYTAYEIGAKLNLILSKL